jgi:CRP-like cAMP-binding protein
VADALVLLHKRYSENKDQNFTIAISRDDLASIVGTATESLIRTLSDFKEEKLVEMKGTNITILDPERLRKLRA